MAKVSKRDEREKRRQEAIARLKSLLREGAAVYVVVHHRTSQTAYVSFYCVSPSLIADEYPLLCLNYEIGVLTDHDTDPSSAHPGLKIIGPDAISSYPPQMVVNRVAGILYGDQRALRTQTL